MKKIRIASIIICIVAVAAWVIISLSYIPTGATSDNLVTLAETMVKNTASTKQQYVMVDGKLYNTSTFERIVMIDKSKDKIVGVPTAFSYTLNTNSRRTFLALVIKEKYVKQDDNLKIYMVNNSTSYTYEVWNKKDGSTILWQSAKEQKEIALTKIGAEYNLIVFNSDLKNRDN